MRASLRISSPNRLLLIIATRNNIFELTSTRNGARWCEQFVLLGWWSEEFSRCADLGLKKPFRVQYSVSSALFARRLTLIQLITAKRLECRAAGIKEKQEKINCCACLSRPPPTAARADCCSVHAAPAPFSARALFAFLRRAPHPSRGFLYIFPLLSRFRHAAPL